MKYPGKKDMGRFDVEMTISNNRDVQLSEAGALPKHKVRRLKVRGLVDLGANWLVLPKKVAVQLGLQEIGDIKVRYADHRSAKRKMVEEVRVELLGRHGTFTAIVEPGRDTALIGAILMEALDLLVDCGTQQLRPRDPHTVTAEIE